MAEDKKDGLKSAFDLAMERLAGKQGPIVHLSDEQKQAIAEVAQRTKAKIAELEILFRDKLAKARAAGDDKKIEELESQMSTEIARCRAREEEEKDRIRQRQ